MNTLQKAAGLAIASFALAGALLAQARPSEACAPPDGVLDVAIVNTGWGNNWFWQSSHLEGYLDAQGPSNRTYLNSSQVNAATLAAFDAVVLTGGDRSWASAQAQADLAAFVQSGGVLLIDPLGGLNGSDPAVAALGSSYNLDWAGWNGDWCGQGNSLQYPDPNHPLLTQPAPVGVFWECDHTSLRTSTLGSAWTPVAVLPNHYWVPGGVTPLAVASSGAGVIVAAGIHFDHTRPGQFQLAANALRICLNQPPVAKCQDVTVNTDAGACSADVAASAFDNGSYDPDGDAISLSVSPAGPYPVGSTSVTLTVTDSKGSSSSCPATVTVIDAEAPSISGASTDKTSLWPPNHEMVDVNVSYSAADNCGVSATSLSVTSNEPQNGLGDGDTDVDWEVVNANTVRLRAERSGKGSGRIYTITITATDAAGNSSSSSVTVTVPHSKKK